MTDSIKPTAQALMLLLLACVLAACAGPLRQPQTTRTAAPADAAEQAITRSDYARAADLYLEAAEQARDPARRERLRLEAGLAAAQAGRVGMANPILDAIRPSSLDDFDRRRYELARTFVRIGNLSPGQALVELPPPPSGMRPEIAERIWHKRAQLHFAQNDVIAGMGDLVQRGVWLVDEDTLRHNDDAIYDRALEAIAFGQGAESRPARDADVTTRGWLALAEIGQRRWVNRSERDQALADWENRYPEHPAARNVLVTRFDYDSDTAPAPRRPGDPGPTPRPISDTIALALPLTGKYANAAQAIRDGFMFTNESASPKPLIYDTNTMSAADLLEQARRDRVGILVGPLDKPKVTEMSRLGSEIPTVALNYTDAPVARPGFYQFALSPEDEARAVVRHARDEGYARALALIPEGSWGERVFAAFRAALRENGGQLVDYARYDTKQHDHRKPIRSVLASGKQGEGVDFIFVAAKPVQARLIRSQLRFYRASNLPMLATSHSYTGTVDSGDDIDLNGVRFVDLPWVVGDGSFISRRRDEAEQRYGDVAARYSRLFAMGMDAALLAGRIADTGLQTGDALEGMTGVLAIRPDGRVRRYLAWAVFRNGRAQLLEMPSISDARDDAPDSDPWARP